MSDWETVGSSNDGWEDIDAARNEVMEGVQRFNDAKDKPNY